MHGYIYLTINLINNKKYIGKKQGNFDPNYLGSGINITRAIKKYGRENFLPKVICECESLFELNKMEKFYIKKYNAAYSEEFYNISLGGDGGNNIAGYSQKQLEEFRLKMKISHNTPEFKKRISAVHKNKIVSQETREKMRNFRKNKPLSESTKKKLSDLNKGSNNRYYGKKHSNEIRKKISDSLQGKNIGKDHWRSQIILVIKDNIVIDKCITQRETIEKYNISRGKLRKCLNEGILFNDLKFKRKE